MNGWLYLLLILAFLYFVLVNVILVLSVRRLSEPEPLFQPASPGNPPADPATDPFVAWAEKEGFLPDSRFDFHGIIGSDQPVALDAWISPDRHTVLLRYRFNDKEWLDIASSLNDHYPLLTSNFHDALILPQPPNVLIQVFVDMPPADLYREHLKSLNYLTGRFGVTLDKVDKPIIELTVQALRKQMAHIRSLPFWYLRGPAWQLLRGRRYRNRSVIELIESLPERHQ